MTETTCLIGTTNPADTEAPPDADRAGGAAAGELVETAEGWQALALATRGTLLTGAELAAAELLPIEAALDLLFPGLDDAARHEALWALDRPAE